MTLLIGFLTFVLVVNCLLLMLLVLIQLPKKEAGAGIAFGGAATDALFGAGSGNALTKMTKYSAGVLIVLSLSLSILNSNVSQASNRRLEEELLKKANETGAVLPTPANTPVADFSIPSQPEGGVSSADVTNLLNTLASNVVSTAGGDSAASTNVNTAPDAPAETAAPGPAPEAEAPDADFPRSAPAAPER